jgi:hypothetical protein
MSNYSSEVKRGEFHWWTGVVESKGDPLKLGRCLVRIFGYHPEDKEQMPTSSLPWAQILLPTNSQNVYPPKHGDMVVGFFMDGAVGQQPVIMGTMPGIPMTEGNSEYPFSDARPEAALATSPRPPESKEYIEDGTGIVITEADTAVLHPIFTDEPSTSRIARNDEDTITETFIQERIDNVTVGVPTALEETWDEPETEYNAKYPWNNVVETESGHIFEMDDTYESERIHLAHRNGSFQEWFPLGDKVEKITKDRYTIVMGNDKIYIMGDVDITVQGNAGIYVQKDATVLVDGNVDATVHGSVTAQVDGDVDATVDGSVTATVGGDVTATIAGNMTADIGGDCTETVGGDMSTDVSGDYNINAGNFTVKAGTINLN